MSDEPSRFAVREVSDPELMNGIALAAETRERPKCCRTRRAEQLALTIMVPKWCHTQVTTTILS